MKKIEKGPGLEKHMLPSELAAYLGTTTRTVRRWMHNPTFPKPSTRNDKGFKLWSPDEAKEALEWLKLRR